MNLDNGLREFSLIRPGADVPGAGRVQGDIADGGGAGAAADAARPHARLHHGLAGREGHAGATGRRAG